MVEFDILKKLFRSLLMEQENKHYAVLNSISIKDVIMLMRKVDKKETELFQKEVEKDGLKDIQSWEKIRAGYDDNQYAKNICSQQIKRIRDRLDAFKEE